MNIRQCLYCKQKFDISDKPKGWMANHSRWCDKNPKRNIYNKNLEYSRSFITKEIRLKSNEAIKRAHNEGKYEGAAKKAAKTRIANGSNLHTEETKQKIREKALSSKHRRLKRGIIEYKGILLDSSWEFELAKRLDYLCIEWIRPEPIPWVDKNGITHNYFPDFYLPKYDIFLDPKNNHARKVQEDKLKIILSEHKNIYIICSLEDCKKFTLQSILPGAPSLL